MSGIIEVSRKLTEEYDITLTSAKTMVVTVMDTIHEFAKEGRIQIGQHIFTPYTRSARKGRNPKTGEALMIGEKKGIKYKFTGDKKKESKVAPAPEPKTKPKKSKKK